MWCLKRPSSKELLVQIGKETTGMVAYMFPQQFHLTNFCVISDVCCIRFFKERTGQTSAAKLFNLQLGCGSWKVAPKRRVCSLENLRFPRCISISLSLSFSPYMCIYIYSLRETVSGFETVAIHGIVGSIPRVGIPTVVWKTQYNHTPTIWT